MLSLTYVSSAVELPDPERLVEMLKRIRPRNQALGLSGMLLYSDGNIMQTLEGPDDVVETIFRTIEADPRHHDIIVILREPTERRAFPDWSMGFRRLSGEHLETLPGYDDFMSRPVAQDLGDNAASAYHLMDSFRSTVR